MSTSKAILAGLICLMPVPAWAQSAVQPPSNGDADEEASKITVGAPNDRTLSGFHASSLQITTEQGDTTVSAALSFDLGDYQPENKVKADRDGFYIVRRTKVGITASVPIDGDGTASRLFYGDNLVTGSKLKLSVTHFTAHLGTGVGSLQIVVDAMSKCVEQSFAADETVGDTYQTLMTALSQSGPGGTMTYDSAFRRAEASGAGGKKIANACYPTVGVDRAYQTPISLIEKYIPSRAQEFRKGFIHDNARMTFLGADASMGRDDHTYLDRTNFKLLTKPRTSWEVAIYAGWINADARFSLRGRLVYGQNFVDNDEAEICRTVSIPAGPECIKGPDGSQMRKRSGLVSVEARQLVTMNDRTTIALAPQVTYRSEDHNLGVEVPIYLAPDSKGQLSGGLKAAYNSKGDEFSIGIFVGVPFSIFF